MRGNLVASVAALCRARTDVLRAEPYRPQAAQEMLQDDPVLVWSGRWWSLTTFWLERRAAFSRAVRERREYVLPARFDDMPLPSCYRIWSRSAYVAPGLRSSSLP